ncbi:MAG: hypothetical protein VKJ04_08565 [Vampirovibrionales bacterium]|nr:hypothetical protein [Vampirovibrionales bacterium]
MGKSKKPDWGDAYDSHKSSLAEHFSQIGQMREHMQQHNRAGQWQESPVMPLDQEIDETWQEADMMENEEVTYYLDEAHEALSRLNQKTNKRNQNQKRPKREDSWY